MLTIEEYAQLCREEEEARHKYPCCENCTQFYIDYGDGYCKLHEMPMEDEAHEKCEDWV